MGCLLVGFIANCQAGVVAQRWAKITQPTQGIAQSIGTYTAGCLSGAAMLPNDGTGYQVMRLSRKRFYGHPDLTHFIENLGQSSYTQQLGTILVGDLGQPRGGPTVSGHRSHTSGLDVDMWFLLSPEAASRPLTATEREKWSAPSVLLGHSDDIDLRHWSIANEQILELAANMPEVDRIFVNPSVKRHLCNQVGGKRDWLRKIRPWYKHDDHFHVRLKCPADSKDCQNQDPLPQGDGCDAKLAWWFTQEAKNPPPSPITEPVEPILPILCDAVLKQ
ncbi:penicillin-insensitive murein endopeptidase [Crenothrix sp. D3]|nr:penicillin-insensitive murein endopeptidase [Crenothrix sp. D3]